MTCTCKMLPGGYLIHSCGLEGKWEKENFGRLFLGANVPVIKKTSVQSIHNEQRFIKMNVFSITGDAFWWFGNQLPNEKVRGRTICVLCVPDHGDKFCGVEGRGTTSRSIISFCGSGPFSYLAVVPWLVK